MFAAFGEYEGADFVEGPGAFVGAAAGEGVVDVGNGHQAGADVDLVAFETLGIAGTVPALVVLEDDDACEAEEGVVAESLFGPSQRFGAVVDVSFHFVEFLVGQGAFLEEDVVAHADLADVVEGNGFVQGLETIIVEVAFELRMAAQGFPEGFDVEACAFEVLPGAWVAHFGEGGEGEQGDVLGFDEVVGDLVDDLFEVCAVTVCGEGLPLLAGALESAFEGAIEVAEVQWFLQEIVGAEVHGFAYVGHIAVGSDDDHAQGCAATVEGFEQLQAVHLRHAQVREQDVGFGRPGNDVECLPPIRGEGEVELAAPDTVGVALGDEGLYVGFIVDDEYAGH